MTILSGSARLIHVSNHLIQNTLGVILPLRYALTELPKIGILFGSDSPQGFLNQRDMMGD
jgi:hypothetical protein